MLGVEDDVESESEVVGVDSGVESGDDRRDNWRSIAGEDADVEGGYPSIYKFSLAVFWGWCRCPG